MPLQSEPPKCLAVVRIRGDINVRREVKDTLRMLHLPRPNSATLVPSTPTYLGMLQKAKDVLTWGEASPDTVRQLLDKRGQLDANRKLTEEHLKKLGFNSMDDVTNALCSLKVNLKDLTPLKPVFRLHPPRKGFKGSVKRSYVEGGETGYRRGYINELILRML
ncbi:MAG: 50S ribosomal protein L30 [Candidatus Bathyarchaeia archaeon]